MIYDNDPELGVSVNHIRFGGRILFSKRFLVAVLVSFVLAHPGRSQNAQDTVLEIDDPRPLAEAVNQLVSRYGCVITYEDPRFAYQDDIQDVTTQVRNDLNRYAPGQAPTVIVPRGGKLTLNVPASTTVSTQTISALLDQLVRAQANRGQGGHFRVLQLEDVFHVVPFEVRDGNGNWIPQSPILDIAISLPDEDRSQVEMLSAITEAVSAKSHNRVFLAGGLGEGISNPNRPRPYHLGSDNERARNVLMRALVLLNDPKNGRWIPQRLTWQLLYDVSDKAYYLNIAPVPDRPSSVVAPMQKAVTGSPTGTLMQPPAMNGTINPHP